MATNLAIDPALLERALELSGEKTKKAVVTTGLILQELLQGFAGPKARIRIIERCAALRSIQLEREDHIGAAELRNTRRRSGVQIGTIDALIAQLCIRHELTLLTMDNDFRLAAAHSPLRIWPSVSKGGARHR